jgi:hypothetical protein
MMTYKAISRGLKFTFLEVNYLGIVVSVRYTTGKRDILYPDALNLVRKKVRFVSSHKLNEFDITFDLPDPERFNQKTISFSFSNISQFSDCTILNEMLKKNQNQIHGELINKAMILIEDLYDIQIKKSQVVDKMNTTFKSKHET